jgi:hypothetical protein
MSQYEYTPDEDKIRKSDNSKVILYTVLGTVAVLLLLGAMFLLGKNLGGTKSASSVSLSSLSLSTSTSSSISSIISSSTASSVSSSISSSSSAPALVVKTYTDTDYKSVSFKYDDTWTVVVGPNQFASGGYIRKDVVITKNGNGTKVTIQLDNAGHGIGGSCANESQLLDIGSGWTRYRSETGTRFYVKTAGINRTGPFAIPFSSELCAADTVASLGTNLGVTDKTLESSHIDAIKLEVVGEDRSIADELIKTLTL